MKGDRAGADFPGKERFSDSVNFYVHNGREGHALGLGHARDRKQMPTG